MNIGEGEVGKHLQRGRGTGKRRNMWKGVGWERREVGKGVGRGRENGRAKGQWMES